MNNTRYESTIIGSGPAGLTASIYLSRAGIKNIIINGTEPGGQLTTTTEVENFPGFPDGILGSELITNMTNQASKFGVEFLHGNVKYISEVTEKSNTQINDENKEINIENYDIVKNNQIENNVIENIKNKSKKIFTIHLESGKTIETKSIVIATGASAKYIGIENEKEFVGRGVSACATCDGFFFRGKEVVVVGGGDTAMIEAIFLSKFASKVTIIHRRNELRASSILVDRAKKIENIEWKLNYTPEKVLVALDDISKLEKVVGIQLRNKETNELEDYATDGIFMAIGRNPNTEFVSKKYIQEISKMSKDSENIQSKAQINDDSSINSNINLENEKIVTLDLENGYIKTAGKSSKTSVEGIFAAGDVQDNKYQQAIVSAGSGAIAAIDVEEYLNQN